MDRTLPTEPTAAGRTVMAISMGGCGAFKYAAEYPGTFSYAGSLSGELDPELPVAQAFQPKTCVHGDPAREEILWRDNDSTALAGNLRGVRLFVRSGDGVPGPFDGARTPADPFQRAVRQMQLVVEAGRASRGAAVPGRGGARAYSRRCCLLPRVALRAVSAPGDAGVRGLVARAIAASGCDPARSR